MLRVALAGVLLGALAGTATADQIKRLVPSNHLQGVADKLRTAITVKKELQVPYGGRVRVRVEVGIASGDGFVVCGFTPLDITDLENPFFIVEHKDFRPYTEEDWPVAANGVIGMFCQGVDGPSGA